MRPLRPAAAIALVVVLAGLLSPAHAQMLRRIEELPEDIPTALAQLEASSPSERGMHRSALVEVARQAVQDQGEQALEPIIAAVENRRRVSDPKLVLNYIIALGELKTRRATDVLLAVLSEPNLELAFQAAKSLGHIWEGAEPSAALRQVNAALLAILYSGYPEVVVRTAGTALMQINKTAVGEAGLLDAAEMRSAFDKWVASAPDALPPLSEMPWQVICRMALHTSDAATRQSAVEILLRRRWLGPVAAIAEALAAGGLTGRQSQTLGRALGELTGVPYPPNDAGSANTPSEVVAEWQKQWLAELRTKSEQRFVDYAWQQFEITLANYMVAPSDATAEQVTCYRGVLLYQLSGRGDMPAYATSKAKSLLTDALAAKKSMSEAIAVLNDPPDEFARGEALNTIEEVVAERYGPEVGKQFFAALVTHAQNEKNVGYARRLGNILWRVAGVPLTLEAPRLAERQEQINTWLSIVRRSGNDIIF